jgi:hypothetical protein
MEFSSPFEFVSYAWLCGLVFHAALHFVVVVCCGFKLFDFWHGDGV